MKLTYNSRNYLKKKHIKTNVSMQSIITNDISNNTFNSNFSKQKSLSKCSNIYLSFENLPNNSLNTPKKKIYKISSKERKPIEKFLLTSIKPFKLRNRKDSKSFLKIEKEKGYKKYNNYHVHILNVMYDKKKKLNFDPLSIKKKIDITKYNIDIPKGYEKDDFFDEKKLKEKRVFVGRMESKLNHEVMKELNKDFIHEKKNENIPKRNSLLKRFSISKRFSASVNHLKFKRVTSANVLKKVEKKKIDIEQIILNNIKRMRDIEKRKKNEEIQKRLILSKKVDDKLHKEYHPIQEFMKNEIKENKKILFKKNKYLFNEETYITDINNFSEKYHFKHKFENVKKERKVDIYIPKLHLSEIINIDALNDNVN